MLTVGLTGGIASGKSFVAAGFAEWGVPVLEADEVARTVVAPGTPALAAIVDRFGASILQGDGTLDRRALREQVFADTVARHDLEAITHPAIRQAMQRWREAQTAPYGIYAAAILIESGQQRAVDRVLVVDAGEDVQRARLLRRDGGSEALARQILNAQLPRATRLAAADDVIDNGEPLRDLAPQLRRLHRLYGRLAQATAATA